MNDQNRVLIRKGARELNPTEAEIVNGGFITLFHLHRRSFSGWRPTRRRGWLLNAFGCA